MIVQFFKNLYIRYKLLIQARSDSRFLLTFSKQETNWTNLLRLCSLLSKNDFKSYNVNKGKKIIIITPYNNVIEFFEHFDILIEASDKEMFSFIRFRELVPKRLSLTEFLTDDDLAIVNITRTKEHISNKIIKLTSVLDALTEPSIITYQNRNLTNILHAARAVLEALLRARALHDKPSKQKTGEKN